MTATKNMDVIAKLTDYERQASDTVSAYIQITLEDTPRLLKIPKSECRRRMDTSSKTKNIELTMSI